MVEKGDRGPATASGYFVSAPGELKREEISLPALPPDWVRLRFLHCGLCGSDLSHFAGRPGARYPVSAGHELVAEVLSVGGAVRGLSPEDIVTTDLNYRCESCDPCRAGRSHLCEDGQQGLFTNRGFSDVGDIEESYLVRLNGAPRRHLALAEPLSCVLHAKRWARLSSGERILVIGAGGLGLCMSFALCNQAPALGFEVTDLMTSRLSRIQQAIAPMGRAVEQPDGEYDVVFDLSGTESGLEAACEHVRGGGRLCSMSHPNGDPVSPFLVGRILRKDVTFTVSYLNGERAILREAAWLLERTWSDAWERTIEVRPLAELQAAYEERPGSPWCKTVIDVAGEAA